MILNIILSAIIFWVVIKTCDYLFYKYKNREPKRDYKKAPIKIDGKKEITILPDGSERTIVEVNGKQIEVIKKDERKEKKDQAIYVKPNVINNYRFE